MGGLINITSPAIIAVISDMFESVGAYGSIRLMSLSLGFAFFLVVASLLNMYQCKVAEDRCLLWSTSLS